MNEWRLGCPELVRLQGPLQTRGLNFLVTPVPCAVLSCQFNSGLQTFTFKKPFLVFKCSDFEWHQAMCAVNLCFPDVQDSDSLLKFPQICSSELIYIKPIPLLKHLNFSKSQANIKAAYAFEAKYIHKNSYSFISETQLLWFLFIYHGSLPPLQPGIQNRRVSLSSYLTFCQCHSRQFILKSLGLHLVQEQNLSISVPQTTSQSFLTRKNLPGEIKKLSISPPRPPQLHLLPSHLSLFWEKRYRIYECTSFLIFSTNILVGTCYVLSAWNTKMPLSRFYLWYSK